MLLLLLVVHSGATSVWTDHDGKTTPCTRARVLTCSWAFWSISVG